MRRLLKRWPVLLAALALAVPVVTSAHGAQTHKATPVRGHPGHGRPPRDRQRLPLPGGVLLRRTMFIYRVAGADGPPSDPANVNNLPQNYNGANEYYSWWKQRV